MMNEHMYKSAMNKVEFSDNLDEKILKVLASHESKEKEIKRPNRRKFYIGLAAILSVLVLTISIAILNNISNPIADNDSQVSMDVSSSYPAYSLEDLVIFSDIISIGRIKAISDPIEIRPVGGGDTDLFTDYTIELEKTFKDSTDNTSKSVPLRMRTEKSGIGVSDDFDYDLKIGDRYLFFLSYPTTGGGYTVDDDHISLVGGSQGLLEIKSEDRFYNPQLSSLETDKLLSVINDPDIEKAADEWDPLSGLKANLDSGFITQEEYDKAIEELSQYAEIVND